MKPSSGTNLRRVTVQLLPLESNSRGGGPVIHEPTSLTTVVIDNLQRIYHIRHTGMSSAQYVTICLFILSTIANYLSYMCIYITPECTLSCVLPNVYLDYPPMIVIFHMRHTGLICVQYVTICLFRLSALQMIYHIYHTRMSSVLCVTKCIFRLPAHGSDLSHTPHRNFLCAICNHMSF